MIAAGQAFLTGLRTLKSEKTFMSNKTIVNQLESFAIYLPANEREEFKNLIASIEEQLAEEYENGREEGRDAGYEDGYADGYAECESEIGAAYDDGYDSGFSDGIASA